jgi:type IV secretion/conjugal transfer VirB4 family ATPase
MDYPYLLTLGQASAGTALLGLMAARAWQADRAVKLSRYRDPWAALPDLLNYGVLIDDGVVLCKNGSLLAGWSFRGPDQQSASGEEREALAKRLNEALCRYGNGWMWHLNAVRRAVRAYNARSEGAFPDPVCAAIDEERRRAFEQTGNVYETEFFLVVTHQLPPEAVRRLADAFFEDERDEGGLPPGAGSLDAFKGFQERVAHLEGRLSEALRLRRLRSRKETDEFGQTVVYNELLRHLQTCVTGEDFPMQVPDLPVHLDALLGGRELVKGTVMRVGEHYVQCVSIDGYPPTSQAGILATLAQLPVAYRWSTRFIFMDPWEAGDHLEKTRRRWAQQVRPFRDQLFRRQTSGKINLDAQTMAQDALEAQELVASGEVVAGYYTSVAVLSGPDREAVEAGAKTLERAINARGFSARVETINTVDAFFGSLPGHGVENVRRPILHSLNVAHLLPVSAVWAGAPHCPCPLYPPQSAPLLYAVTSGRSAFRVNLHDGDLGHSIIFGPTASGKTTLLSLIAAQLRKYRGMSIYAFDQGLGLFPICKAAGGDHYHVAGENAKLAFCPLGHLETWEDLAWAADWVAKVVQVATDKKLTPRQEAKVWDALSNLQARGHRTLSDLYNTLQDIELREALLPYTVRGAMGGTFDAREDNLQGFGRFVVFEVEDLMRLSEKFVLPLLWYLFRRIRRSLTGQPAAIILDEAWLMLSHPAFRDQIKEWLQMLRKANCMVILATQALSHAAKSGILDIIVESTATKVFLPNAHALQPDSAQYYDAFGLSRKQLALLAGATPKRDYYLVQRQGRRLFDLDLGPLAKAFCTVGDKESLAKIRRLEAQHGQRWPLHWLSERNLRLCDYVDLSALSWNPAEERAA